MRALTIAELMSPAIANLHPLYVQEFLKAGRRRDPRVQAGPGQAPGGLVLYDPFRGESGVHPAVVDDPVPLLHGGRARRALAVLLHEQDRLGALRLGHRPVAAGRRHRLHRPAPHLALRQLPQTGPLPDDDLRRVPRLVRTRHRPGPSPSSTRSRGPAARKSSSCGPTSGVLP